MTTMRVRQRQGKIGSRLKAGRTPWGGVGDVALVGLACHYIHLWDGICKDVRLNPTSPNRVWNDVSQR